MASNATDVCSVLEQNVPQWKRELILRRRSMGRTLQVGNSSVKLTCPAVVAYVRQPESIGNEVSDCATTTKQQFSGQTEELTPLCSSNQSHPHSEDFHLGTQSSSGTSDPVRIMRLLDESSDGNCLVTNGTVVKSKQSDCSSGSLCDNYNLVMGEDKLSNHKKNSAPLNAKPGYCGCVNRQIQENGVGLSFNGIDHKSNRGCLGLNGLSSKEDDCSSDSGEELRYGPGIVDKLKSKYLSMTLREQKRHSRPSIINLRRASSLENMLEADDSLNQNRPPNEVESSNVSNIKNENIKLNRRSVYVGQRRPNSHHGLKFIGNRSRDTMKRARSMETLLKSETRVPVTIKSVAVNVNEKAFTSGIDTLRGLSASPRKSMASIVNENIVIVESSTPDLCSNACKYDSEQNSDVSSKLAMRPSENVNTPAELPPPDLVKQALKIFETSPTKRMRPNIQSNLSKHVTGFSIPPVINKKTSTPNKSYVDKTRIVPNKPTLSPKPVFSPEKLKQNRTKTSSQKTCEIFRSTNSNLNNRPNTNISAPKMVTSCKTFERKQIGLSENPQFSENSCESFSENSTSSLQEVSVHLNTGLPSVPNNLSLSTICDKTGQVTNPIKQQHNDEKSFTNQKFKILEEIDGAATGCSKSVPESALENIRRGGVSVQFSFKNDSQDCSGPKTYLPAPKSPTQALNVLLLNKNFEKSSSVSNIAPLKSSGSPHTITKQVGIIRPLVTTKSQPAIMPSSHLTDQEIEKNLINCVKSIEQPISKVLVSIKALPDSVVLGSSDVVSTQNVSNNTKMKKLWDEKLWHQSQNTIVFNFSDRKEVPDYIENDGLILGKRDRLRPQQQEDGVTLLDESSTDAEDFFTSDPPSPCDVTFEGDNILINGKSNLKKSPKQVKLRIKFNDEATTMYEYPSEASLAEGDSSQTVGGNNQSSSQSPSTSNPPSPTLPQALGGGGSLGAYTPRKMGSGDWQLGVTPVLSPSVHSTTASSLNAQLEEEHLKPTESTTAWSEDTASDLLF